MVETRVTHMLFFVIGLLVAVWSPRASAAELEPGEIEVDVRQVPGSDVPEITVRGIVDAKPEKIWGILTDCSDFEHVFSDVKSAELIEEKGEADICSETVAMPFPFSDLTAITRVTYEVEDDRWVRRWSLIRGDYEMNSGTWTLEAIDGGERTIAEYTLHADPKMPVPDWLRDMVQEDKMPGVIEDIRRAASSN